LGKPLAGSKAVSNSADKSWIFFQDLEFCFDQLLRRSALFNSSHPFSLGLLIGQALLLRVAVPEARSRVTQSSWRSAKSDSGGAAAVMHLLVLPGGMKDSANKLSHVSLGLTSSVSIEDSSVSKS